MSQDEFNSAETESKLRMELVYQEVQKRNKAMDREYERPWFGLTEDEAEDIYRIVRPDVMKFWRLCEAKLKERNT